jgi:hypothetical protein
VEARNFACPEQGVVGANFFPPEEETRFSLDKRTAPQGLAASVLFHERRQRRDGNACLTSAGFAGFFRKIWRIFLCPSVPFPLFSSEGKQQDPLQGV